MALNVALSMALNMVSIRLVAAALLVATPTIVNGQVDLGSLSSFGLLAAIGLTSLGTSIVDGNIGTFPGFYMTGFPPGIVNNGAIYGPDAITQKAHNDLSAAMSQAIALTATAVSLSLELGGLVFSPGVIDMPEDGSASLSSTVYLFTNDMSAMWIFRIPGSFSIAPTGAVELINGGVSCNVIWLVGNEVFAEGPSTLKGNFLVGRDIILGNGTTSMGGLYSSDGQVALDNGTVDRCVFPPRSETTATAMMSTVMTGSDASTTTTTDPPPTTPTDTTSPTATDTTAAETASTMATDITATDTTATTATTLATSLTHSGSATASTTTPTSTAGGTGRSRTAATGITSTANVAGRSRSTTATTATPTTHVSTETPAAAANLATARGGRGNITTTITAITLAVTCPVAPTVITLCGQEFHTKSPGVRVLVAASTITLQKSAACKDCVGDRLPGKNRPTATPCLTYNSHGASESNIKAAGSKVAALIYDGRPHASERVASQSPDEVTAAASDTATPSTCLVPVVTILLLLFNLC